MPGLTPSFSVPAAYFYALGAGLPSSVAASERFTIFTGQGEAALAQRLQQAIDDGTIKLADAGGVTPLQAARRLVALGRAAGTSAPCKIGPADDGSKLVGRWLASTDSDEQLWPGLLTTGSAAAKAQDRRGQLKLIVCALTGWDDVPPATVLSDFVAAIRQPIAGGGLGVSDADGLAQVTADQWWAFLTANPQFLPPFTSPPGATVSRADRIRAFLRRVQHFYTTGLLTPQDVVLAPGAPPMLDRLGFDPLQAFLTEYYDATGVAFQFGTSAAGDASASAAVAAVFPADAAAARWLSGAIATISELAGVTAGLIPAAAPNAGSLQFSIVEALYSCGFTSKASIAALDAADFDAAVSGTVAHQWAAQIWTAAGGTASAGGSAPGPFAPINDGSLSNCLAPPERSPLGPVQYLSELLAAGTDSTCTQPTSPSGTGFGTLLATRRGDLGSLQVTAANLSAPVPVVDLVNECLEHLAAGAGGGSVYDTGSDDERLLAAAPEHSSPGPLGSPTAYDALAGDFSAPCLPYNQPLDVNRSYLCEMGTNRFELLRRFRAQITEFALDTTDPAGFDATVWRYPVRRDVAIEYLCIDPAEYERLFTTPLAPAALHGFETRGPRDTSWTQDAVSLAQLLPRTGLSYCEFLELWRSGYVPFARRGEIAEFDPCEPCCLEEIGIVFTGGRDGRRGAKGARAAASLQTLGTFVRLWRKLRCVPCAGYSFTELADICTVLELTKGGAINPEFVPELAAMQMLRDELCLPLGFLENAPAAGAARTRLLALWADPPAPAGAWEWAVGELLGRLEAFARKRHGCERREARFVELLAANLDQLSVLAGFDPALATDTWHASPRCTLRFVEVLAKLYASDFTFGELELLCAGVHVDGEDAFPLSSDEEALDDPLELPDDERHSLWELRRELLRAAVDEEELERWSWPRIQTAMASEFGYAASAGADPLGSLAQHAFPGVLEREGQHVPAAARRYVSPLVAADTSPGMWIGEGDEPFHYDAAAGQLSIELPLADEEALETLARLRQLKSAGAPASELGAVLDLYWQPHADLAALGFLFADLGEADHHLIQHGDEHERWSYFRHAFVLARKRCRIIARFLARHADRDHHEDDERSAERAWLVLRALHGDENLATTSWEGGQPDGTPPPLTWAAPAGGAFAALLGLCGTGLLTEYDDLDGNPIWRETSGALEGFGSVRDRWNAPLPTMIPALDAPNPAGGSADARNGIAFSQETDKRLGGAQGFAVTWSGVLLVEHAGRHRFAAGAPTAEGEHPDVERAERDGWRITLSRGQREWVLLSHGWPGRPDSAHETELALRRGAYSITVELSRPAPVFAQPDDLRRQHAGFQVKYAGPDTGERLIAIPRTRLFIASKDNSLALAPSRIEPPSASALAALAGRCPSTLRDIRRTYQRAFHALLLVSRFALSARRREDGESELGFMLAHPARFAGSSYYRSGGAFAPHRVQLDFDFLPVIDNYLAPEPAADARAAPSPQRQAALLDVWERLFDYARLRRENGEHHRRRRSLWRLFAVGDDANPSEVLQLAPNLDVELDHNDIVQTFWGLAGVLGEPELTAGNLLDERWPIRAWKAERWVRRLESACLLEDVATAQPALWAAEDPSASGGNANLTELLQTAMTTGAGPRRHRDLRALDDGLRDRARCALLAYLTRMDRVALPGPPVAYATRPEHLSELLLLDVEAGLSERRSRIDDAVTAVQAFVQRARLGLEPGVSLAPGFIELWDGRFASFRCWQACKRRELYPENAIEWDELEVARRDEGFCLLEHQLREAALSVPVPAGIQYWDDLEPPEHPGLEALQAHEPSTLHLPVAVDPGAAPSDAAVPSEAFGLLGRPERAARPAWLALLTTSTPPGVRQPDTPRDPAGAPEIRAELTTLAPAAAGEPAPAPAPGKLPYWIEAAIDLGARFLRVAAAGEPGGSSVLRPRDGGQPCCAQCGGVHPPCVDEYYFWLAEAEYFDLPAPQDADRYGTTDDDSDWENPAIFPKLLAWDPQPMVHLHWCRVHNGELGELRRSTEGVALDASLLGDPAGPPTLELRGRRGDSLVFRVQDGSGIPPGAIPAFLGGDAFTWQPPYTGWTAETGWRYDLADDDATLLPLVATPPASDLMPAALPAPDLFGGLAAYPFFSYFTPGAPLVPLSPFAPAVAVAGALRAHCRYEAALAWYHLCYDPLAGDNGIGCDEQPATGELARQRAITLAELETLLGWGDALMGVHCECGTLSGNSLEASARARVIFDAAERILGPLPSTVMLGLPPGPPPTVSGFSALAAPLNSRLMSLYERIADRTTLIHESDNRRRRRYGELGEGVSFWGEDPARDGWRVAREGCCDAGDWCCPPSPYRFVFLVQKALELAGEVRSFGAELLAAYEKGDAEYLAALRASHERQLLTLAREIRKDQWRDADWQVQALKQAKLSAHNQLAYYNGLVAGGLNTDENLYVDLTGVAMGLQVAAQVFELIAQLGGVIPDAYVGTVDFVKIPMTGSSFTNFFDSAGKGLGFLAQDIQSGAGLALTEGGWDRRLAEWEHEVDIFTIEIERLQREILGAERRADVALRELNSQQRQIEQAGEAEAFLRDKFTNHALYLFHQRETAGLYRGLYELALDAARQAQRAFNLERGYTAETFIEGELWDDLHHGLLAGERLELALRRMEKCYLDRNRREYELTKHVSLRRDFPLALLQLKTNGCCEIELPEWMFDLDYPGQYMRRIKNVSITVPCVVGPYTGVHCRLTLLSSQTRADPRLHGRVERCCGEEEPHDCCCEAAGECCGSGEERRGRCCGCGDCGEGGHGGCCEHGHGGYRPVPDDPRIVRSFAAADGIATSSAQNDNGMFELSFSDQRYLPFEFAGAVSRWRIELPRENNQFDFDSITDFVLHLNYTAREGGDALRRAARSESCCRLPGDGMRLFDVRHEFPDAWPALRRRCGRDGGREHRRERGEHRREDGEQRRDDDQRVLRPRLIASMFPFIQGRRARWIDRLMVFFAAPDAEPGRHHLVRFRPVEDEDDDRADRDLVQDLQCIASRAWPGLFCGVVDLSDAPIGPLPSESPEVRFTLEFPERIGEICGAYLLAGYRADCWPRCGEGPACGCGRECGCECDEGERGERAGRGRG